MSPNSSGIAPTMELSEATRSFIGQWGEMGGVWGINRTMAQVHGLLFIWPDPLDAEQISQALDVSRSNVSTSLRELIQWGIVRRVHAIGDRRDKFEAEHDVLTALRVILAQRKRRELDPAVELLQSSLARIQSNPSDRDDFVANQLRAMLRILSLLSQWHEQVERLPDTTLQSLLQAGSLERPES